MRCSPRRLTTLVGGAVVVALSLHWLGILSWDGRHKQMVQWKKDNGFQLERGSATAAPPLMWSKESIFWNETSGIKKGKNAPLSGSPPASYEPHLSAQIVSYTEADDAMVKAADSVLDKNDAQGSNGDNSWDEQSHHSYNINIRRSDLIPLNRDVPDSRPHRCASLKYPETLPTTSVVITMHNEWPSVILRTIYSIIKRTPKHLLKEIILVDDASDTDLIKTRLKRYISWNFSHRLVKLVRLNTRQGLIRARLEGLRHVTGQVVAFFDSHMEVNQDWLQPLLYEIVKKKETIALAQLDYINRDTFSYDFYPGYRTRYGFRWDIAFFETYFRPDQLDGKSSTDPLPGVLFVGTGFAVDVDYFKYIGTYDHGMMIWGGENVELAWRVWMCGGQILHVPCSRIGHVERSQPYVFPIGRANTEMYNYKRAVDVWLGGYKKYVYNIYPGMEKLDIGSLDERRKTVANLNCHNFTWFIDNIWPELLRYQEDGDTWGMIRSTADEDVCLDNDDFVFKGPNPLAIRPCSFNIQRQGYTRTRSGQLRTTIHCIVALPSGEDIMPFVENCFLRPPQLWDHTENQQLLHVPSGLCLQAMKMGADRVAVMQPCSSTTAAQKWTFVTEGML